MQALAFARAREGIPGGDMDRGRREQKVIRALFNKAKDIGAIPKMPELFLQFQRDVKTDLPIDRMIALGNLAGNFSDGVIRSRFLDDAGLKNELLPEVGYVLIPDWKGLPAFLQQSLTVALNQRPNDAIPIEVLNGTGIPGYGIASADRLAELGFRIVNVANADQYVPATQIINHETTSKGSAIPLLQRTFKINDASIVSQPGAGGEGAEAPRYRILIGDDFNPCYRGYRVAPRITPPPPEEPTPTPEAPTPEAPTPDPNQAPTADPNQAQPTAPPEQPPPAVEPTQVPLPDAGSTPTIQP